MASPGPGDVRRRNSPATEAEAEEALSAWKHRDAEHRAERDQLVHAAYPLLGRNIRRLARLIGLSRTTVYAIIREQVEQQSETTTEERQ